jgi:phage terminase large subunit-like protein
VSRDTHIEDGAEVILGFDGSFNNDSTALVVVKVPTGDELPHVDVVDAWEKPREAANDWAVPIIDVEASIIAACERWQVREIACDPARWARTYQILEEQGLPVVKFPQSPARMIPATQSFYEAVMNKTITHSGDQRLSRHLSNCVIRTDARGSRISKDAKNSPRKIDLAVSAVMALERAMFKPDPEPEPMFFNWNDL